jgi:hypothetical protein
MKVITVAALGTSSTEPLWKRPIREGAGEAPPVDYGKAPVELAGGRAYVVYPIRIPQDPWTAWRMQALEVTTGVEVWDVPLEASGLSGPHSAPAMAMTEKRIYVAYEHWLQIHVRDTGERVGRIGP